MQNNMLNRTRRDNLLLTKNTLKCLSIVGIVGVLAACNGGGGGSGGSQNVTPPIYNGQAPESYNATLNNGSVLQTSTDLLFSNTQANQVIFSLESNISTTVNLSSSLSISPTSCAFDSSNKYCIITIADNDIQTGVNYTITPSSDSQDLPAINLSFAAPFTQSMTVNMDGTWIKYTSGDITVSPFDCTPMILGQGDIYIISGNSQTIISPDGTSFVEPALNPVQLPITTSRDGVTNTMQYVAPGVVGHITTSSICGTSYYTSMTKISNSVNP